MPFTIQGDTATPGDDCVDPDRIHPVNEGNVHSAAAPLAVDAAARVRLVAQSNTGSDTAINCRRVVTLLGARPGCKVNLRHKRIAPVHAAIVNNGSDVIVVDLVTKHGTRLNGLKMEYERLSDGDTLSMGPWTFRVDIEQRRDNGDDDVHPMDLDPTPRVIALEHLDTGKILQPGREVCIIGRRSGCDITLSDPTVSRTHAMLLNLFGYPAIMDLLTQNGTLVNDVPTSFRTLRNDDVLSIGDSQFRVRLLGSSISAQAGNGKLMSTPRSDSPANDTGPDLIDIEATEQAKRWRIADSVERATPKP